MGADPVSISLKTEEPELITALLEHPAIDWRSENYWTSEPSFGRALRAAFTAQPAAFGPALGIHFGRFIAKNGHPPTDAGIGPALAHFDISGASVLVFAVQPAALLWAWLFKLAELEKNSWSNRTEITGVQAELLNVVHETPGLWAADLAKVLFYSDVLGKTIEGLILASAVERAAVRRSLEQACLHEIEKIRLLAIGLRAILEGFEQPGVVIERRLLDAISRMIDGRPIFPHPLQGPASTWLADLALEGVIRSGVRQACARFAPEVVDQGADIEETLTKSLVKELEFAFREGAPNSN